MIWSHDNDQWIPWFNRCQLNITWMSNIRHAVNQGLVLMEYNGHYVAWSCCCHCWALPPVIHAASHVDYEKWVAWFSFSMRTCDSVPIVAVLSSAYFQSFYRIVKSIWTCLGKLHYINYYYYFYYYLILTGGHPNPVKLLFKRHA